MKVKTSFLLLAALLLVPLGTVAQDISCTPTTAVSKQHRSDLKHRDPASTEPHSATVAKVLQWAAPSGVADPKTRKSKVPIDSRESEVFKLTGDLWRVIVEENDCDFHLELAAPGQPATAARVIVELPQGEAFRTQREKLIEELTANGYSLSVGTART